MELAGLQNWRQRIIFPCAAKKQSCGSKRTGLLLRNLSQVAILGMYRN